MITKSQFIKSWTRFSLIFLLPTLNLAANQPADHLLFEAQKGQFGKGKHVVLIAGDDEYRSEEAMPMLAQILATHGFKCTVLFSMDDDNKFINPGNQESISNSSALDSADAILMSLRFRNYSENDMAKFDAAFRRGIPIVALRTSTHAFRLPKEHKYYKYHWRAEKDTGWEGGFGKHVLGETWVSHHGRHKKQGCLTIVEKGAEKNPLLNGVSAIFCKSDVYGIRNATPTQPSSILLRGLVTESLERDSKPIAGAKNNPTMPVAWTRQYKQASGKINKIFTTTMGSSDDLLDENLRRLIVNATYWGLGLNIPAKADVTFQQKYEPTFYGFETFKKGMTPSDMIELTRDEGTEQGQKGAAVKEQAKSKPSLVTISKNSRLGFVGGGLGSRMNLFSEFETELQRRYPSYQLYIRNLCHEGDTPAFRPHPSRNSHWVLESLKDKGKSLMKPEYQKGKGKGTYETPDQWLKRHQIDTVIGFFGYSESYDGTRGEQITRYQNELRQFIRHTLKMAYSKKQTQLAIVGPAAFEDLSSKYDIPNGKSANAALSIYTRAMQEVCAEEGVVFVDTFKITSGLYADSEPFLTSNGHNLNALGYQKLAPILANQLFGKKLASGDYRDIKAAVAEKNRLWIEDYKIPNGVHVHGRRYTPYGNKNYPDELKKLREMADIRDQAIWAANRGKKFDVAQADAKTHKLKKIETNSELPNVYKSGKEVEKLLEMAEGYKVELFACEKTFPDLQNPSQMAFDNEGRLWVSCMGSYPHWRVGDPAPNDKIIIFEDTDKDGKADKQINFVENIHIPMGFEITEHGVFVSLGKNLVLFKDTDGDSKADYSEVVLSGFDDHDTHHAISSFCADPSGAIYMAEGTFLHSNVETPYGPVRGTNGGFYRYNPNKMHLERTAQYRIPNPWGIAFNEWGQNFFLHTSGTSFSWMQRGAIKPRYNQNLKAPNILSSNKVRPTSGVEFVSSRHFPDEVQGDIIICNNIGFLGAKQHTLVDDPESGFFKSEFRHNLFVSPAEYQYFRPVDLEFAPDGSLFFIDWSNVLIGHMQHSARDPKRDHVHGRVYRITYPSRKLVEPAKVAGASIEQLLENLKLPELRSRYRSRRELRGRDPKTVAKAIENWVAQLNSKDPKYEHHLLEALWVSWGINRIDPSLLEQVLKAEDYRARTAAVRAVRYNADKLPKAAEYIMVAAEDAHPQVRHEAVIQASWMDKDIGLAILKTAKQQPISSWSADAFKFAEAGLNDLQIIGIAKNVPLPKGILIDNKDFTKVQINCVEKSLSFDVKTVKVKKGKKVQILFTNPDDMQHNLVIVEPGTADEVALQAINLGPKGNALNWLPKHDGVIKGSKLLNKGEQQRFEVRFSSAGKYPFICTFPGHATPMRGYFIVQ